MAGWDNQSGRVSSGPENLTTFVSYTLVARLGDREPQNSLGMMCVRRTSASGSCGSFGAGGTVEEYHEPEKTPRSFSLSTSGVGCLVCLPLAGVQPSLGSLFSLRGGIRQETRQLARDSARGRQERGRGRTIGRKIPILIFGCWSSGWERDWASLMVTIQRE